MTAADQPGAAPLSAAELEAFAAKLDAWRQDLTERERAFLVEILERAAAAGDVQGHAIINAWPKKYTGVGLKADVAATPLLPTLQAIAAPREP